MKSKTLNIKDLESVSTDGALEIRQSEGEIEFLQHGEIMEDLFSNGGFTINLVDKPRRMFFSEDGWTNIFDDTLTRFRDEVVIGFDFQVFIVGQIYQSEIKVFRRDEAYIAFQIFSFIELEIIENSRKVIDFLNDYYGLEPQNKSEYDYQDALDLVSEINLKGLEIDADKGSVSFLQTGRESANWTHHLLKLIFAGAYIWMLIISVRELSFFSFFLSLVLLNLANYALKKNPVRDKNLIYRNCKFSNNFFEFKNDKETVSYIPCNELEGIKVSIKSEGEVYKSSLKIGTHNEPFTFLELYAATLNEVENVSKSITKFLENNFQIPIVEKIEKNLNQEQILDLNMKLSDVQSELDSEQFTIQKENGRLILRAYLQSYSAYVDSQIPILSTEIGNNKIAIQFGNTKDLVRKNEVLMFNYKIEKIGGIFYSNWNEAKVYVQTHEESILFIKLNHRSKQILERRVIMLIDFLKEYIKK